ncbi:hypothetical protein ETB97_010046 [Aspergillus alliaceus]|uniref:Uncharacterized protein n=1 Tax=Petromyces alliaceus TaxID=209559 RepID=A0A8H6E0G9_PETAA|nr:hypothetical protein ETB97_010046 [Aspergillus burnettii]
MAWFSSIINGVGSAVNWALSNSGVVKPLLDTVATVAKNLLGGLETEEGFIIIEGLDDPEDCKNLLKNFKEADKNLKKKAEEAAKQVEKGVPTGGSTRNEVLSGLWTNPGLTENGNATPEMYRDLAKFLEEKEIPTQLQNDNGTVTDVPQEIATAIFANDPNVPAPGDIEGVAVRFPTFQIGNGSCFITGAHAYYAVPLGKSISGIESDDHAWHGAVHVTKATTAEFDQQYTEHKKSLVLVAEDRETQAGVVPRWVVTCQVDWRTVLQATKASFDVEAQLRKLYPEYELLYSNVDGQSQIIKVRAPEGIRPPQVRAVIHKVVTETSKKLAKPGGNIGGAHTDINLQESENISSTQMQYVLDLLVTEAAKKLTIPKTESSNDPGLQTPEVTVTASVLVP